MPMMKLSIGIALAACAGAGWFVRKALVRINAWGEKMNEQDAIFRTAEGDYARERVASAHARARNITRPREDRPTGDDARSLAEVAPRDVALVALCPQPLRIRANRVN